MPNGNDLGLPDAGSENPLLPQGQGRVFDDKEGPRLSMDQIYALALKHGFSPGSARLMTAIVMGESGGRTGAFNPNDPHGGSFGLTQINGAHIGAESAWHNPDVAMRMAYHISGGGRDFRAWGAYNNGGYRRYLAQAESLAGGGRAFAEAGPIAGTTVTDATAPQINIPTVPPQGPYYGLVSPEGQVPQATAAAPSYVPGGPGDPRFGGAGVAGLAGTPSGAAVSPAGPLPTIVPGGPNDPRFGGAGIQGMPGTQSGPAISPAVNWPGAEAVAQIAQEQATGKTGAAGAAMGGAGGPEGGAAGAGVTNPAQMPQISKSMAMFGMLAALARGYRPIQINYDPFKIYEQTIQPPEFPRNVVGRLTPDAGPPVIPRTIAGGQPIQGEQNPFRRYIPNY